MNVYITYDRYEHNEWLSVYHIETNKQRAIKHFRETDLIDFLSYGPDDCHSFQLQKVVLSKSQYDKLCYLVETEKDCESCYEQELKEMLIAFFEEDEEYDVETLASTDGCSDNIELAEYYCDKLGIDEEDEDKREEIKEKVWNDEELYLKVLKEWIKLNY